MARNVSCSFGVGYELRTTNVQSLYAKSNEGGVSWDLSSLKSCFYVKLVSDTTLWTE